MKYLGKILFLLALLGGSTAFAAQSVPVEKLKPLLQEKQGLEGRVLLYFWASWCPDCREKLAGPLRELAGEFPSATMLTVNADRDEGKGKSYAEENKIGLPVYRDEEKALTKALKLFAVPAWAVVEKTAGGWMLLGSSTGSDLAEIRKVLRRGEK